MIGWIAVCCIVVIAWALFLGGSHWSHAVEVIVALLVLLALVLFGGAR